VIRGGTNGDDVLRRTDAPIWLWDLAHDSQLTFHDCWTLAVPRWGKGHLTNLACYSVLRSRLTQERFRFQKQSIRGTCGSCIPSYLALSCNAAGLPTGPLPPYREEGRREVVLSGRPALLLVALVAAVVAIGLIGGPSAVSALSDNADSRNDSERVRSLSWSKPTR
jgi:hypothetical protein